MANEKKKAQEREVGKKYTMYEAGCDNPFGMKKHSRDIVSYIIKGGKIFSCCSECWRKVNDPRRTEKFQWSSEEVT